VRGGEGTKVEQIGEREKGVEKKKKKLTAKSERFGGGPKLENNMGKKRREKTTKWMWGMKQNTKKREDGVWSSSDITQIKSTERYKNKSKEGKYAEGVQKKKEVGLGWTRGLQQRWCQMEGGRIGLR